MTYCSAIAHSLDTMISPRETGVSTSLDKKKMSMRYVEIIMYTISIIIINIIVFYLT